MSVQNRGRFCQRPVERFEKCLVLLLTLGQEIGAFQRRAQGEVEDDGADRGGHAVDEGDAAGDLGKSLCDGVLLTENVNIAEVVQKKENMKEN